MAVLAQMHVARLQYAFAVQQFNRADAMWLVDDRINGHTANREKAEAQGRLESVANNTAAILSLLRRYQALSQVHAASGKLQATLGMEPQLGSVRELSLSELTEAVRRSLKEWEDGQLPAVPETPAAQPVSKPQAALPESTVAIPVADATPASPVAERSSEVESQAAADAAKPTPVDAAVVDVPPQPAAALPVAEPVAASVADEPDMRVHATDDPSVTKG